MKNHIQITPNPKVTRALVCGAPERAETISKMLSKSRPLAKNREYHSYAGEYDGKPVLIISHGVGSAGAALCFNELIDCGIQSLVRVGTAGGLVEGAKIGDIVIAEAAIRHDGVSSLMVPAEFPAVANRSLTNYLEGALKQKGWSGKSGIILTSDLFYKGLLDDKLAFYQRAHAIAVEMECSTLFAIASLRKARAAAVLVLDGNPLKWDQGDYDPDPKRLAQSIQQSAEAALSTLVHG